MNRQPVTVAYGLLWLFAGEDDAAHIQRLPLVHSARRHLRDMLTQDEMRDGITMAKDIAEALNINTEFSPT